MRGENSLTRKKAGWKKREGASKAKTEARNRGGTSRNEPGRSQAYGGVGGGEGKKFGKREKRKYGKKPQNKKSSCA